VFRILLCVSITVITCLADGHTPWPRHTIDDTSDGADGVRLTDVNGDGLLDIVTGWEEGGIVRAYLHPGRGTEKKRWPSTTVGNVASPEDAVFADLDGDGAFDVISACEGKTRSLFVHWAPDSAPANFMDPLKWTTEAIPVAKGAQSWMYSLPMQVDGKNGIDLIVGSKGTGAAVGWLEAPANARTLHDWRYHRLQDAGWIMSLIAADMDGDGDTDVLVSDRKGEKRGVYWLERPVNASEDSWHRHEVGGAHREILFIDHGDLDQDGRLDVIASEKRSLLWFRRTKGGWEEHLIPLPRGVGGGKSATICDVDCDGKMDIVFSCEGAKGKLSGMRWLSWKDSPASGHWSDHEVSGEPGTKFDRVVASDIDGDGDLDLLCCEERDGLGVFWYENPTKQVKPES
jgi:hypothetical protein